MTVFECKCLFLTIIYNFYRTGPHSGVGDEDEDKDKDKDEDKDVIPNYIVLLTTSLKRFGVCRKRDFWVSVVTFVKFRSNRGKFDKNNFFFKTKNIKKKKKKLKCEIREEYFF